MKKIFRYTARTLAFALALMTMGCANYHSNTTSSAAPAATSDIAYVNMDSLVDKYDLYNDLSTQLMAKQNQLEQELQSKQKSIDRKAMDLDNQMKKNLITPTRAQEVYNNLQTEQQRMVQWRDEKMMELSDDQAKINRMVYDSIQSYVNEYNASKKYRFILSNSTGGVLLYGDPAANITNDILTALNSRYNKSGKNTTLDSLATK